MSHRLFEGKTHAELYLKYRSKIPPELLETILNFLKEKYKGDLNLALDVGCGSGQTTFSLAKYFKEAVGTDVSPSQIEAANQALGEITNVKFLVSPAETLPFEDNCAQLITAAQALHWFDIPRFFVEAQRLLCPGGVLSIFSYMFPTILECDSDLAKGLQLQDAFKNVWENDLGAYWNERFKIPLNKYKDVTIPPPFCDFTRFDQDEFYEERTVPLESILNNIRTWSGFNTLVEKNGEDAGEKVLQNFCQRASSIVGEGHPNFANPEKILIKEKTPVALIIARMPLK